MENITTIRGNPAHVQMLIRIIKENSSLRMAPHLTRAAEAQITGLYEFTETYRSDTDRAFVQNESLNAFKDAKDPQFADFCDWLNSCDKFAKGPAGNVINRFCVLYQGHG